MSTKRQHIEAAPELKIGRRTDLCTDCQVRDRAACSVLEPWELDRMSDIAEQKDLRAGETLFEEGDEPRYMYNLVSGTVRLFKLLPNGRRQIVGFVFPGDMLGLASHGAHTAFAEAIDDVKVCRFPREKMLTLLEEFPHLKGRLLDIAANELSHVHDQMVLLGRKSPVEKVASFLLQLRGENVRCDMPDDRIDLAMGRSDIADYLGLTIETVSRTFTKLRNDKIIELDGAQHVLLKNPDALEDLVGD